MAMTADVEATMEDAVATSRIVGAQNHEATHRINQDPNHKPRMHASDADRMVMPQTTVGPRTRSATIATK